ncbi:MAG: glycosyltransferase family 2 protein [Bacteroidia bacterium]|nr:glycosyltransferase family 2 protein [Bacteroidia bacterium]
MKISGFTFVRNAAKLCYPVKESILSILPICDEFIIAMGDNDEDDQTQAIIDSIGSDKIKIYHRPWDKERFKSGLIFKDETDFALSKCTGDWCFYIQADEVVHEKDHENIVEACKKYLYEPEVQGLLFRYNHFWGDYDHRIHAHTWYKEEIRIVRNGVDITSYKDAQSFRLNNVEKLNVKSIDAEMYHYGWVRPPRLMQTKNERQQSFYMGRKEKQSILDEFFDYGPVGRIPQFTGTHPAVMQDMISAFDWADKINYSKSGFLRSNRFKHERLKYRVLTWVENNLFGGKTIFGFHNFIKLP